MVKIAEFQMEAFYDRSSCLGGFHLNFVTVISPLEAHFFFASSVSDRMEVVYIFWYSRCD